MINKKSLELNIDQSNFLIMGRNKVRNRIQEELDDNPLQLCSVNMKQVKALKYLGDFLTNDLSDSVHQTVIKRIAIATISIYEIRGIVEDRRAMCLGGINVGLNIFISSIIPMVFFNSETWTCIAKKTSKSLLEFFCPFYVLELELLKQTSSGRQECFCLTT